MVFWIYGWNIPYVKYMCSLSGVRSRLPDSSIIPPLAAVVPKEGMVGT